MASTRDIQNFIPKEVESDKAAYWQMRDQLLKKYKGQWVAIYQGQIVGAGDDLLKLTEEVYDKGCKYAYINRVGEEDTTIFKIRRKEYPYNTEYRPFPLPEASVTFSNLTRTKQKEVVVIPDTGADLTSLLAEDCIDIGVVARQLSRRRDILWGL